jgi:hypothetical protein
MDDILAWKAGDVLAGTAYVPALNVGYLHSGSGQGPGDEFAARSAAQHEQIVLFQI